MAESYSVKAILSAADRGFSSTINKAISTTETLASRIKSGFSFGVLTGMGQQAFSALTSGASDLVGEINNSNKAWKTFEGNMKILGKSEKEIDSVKGALQQYAQESIYSSSDMASTYAQLASVGVKSADKLVTGFGGLAAAAENPAQAMKTLSQQAVQMAAKPNVAWSDFKLMLEQTPAGIAAVAKEMGMSTSDLVKKVQKGTVKTEDFFNAINKVGNSDSFNKLATSYKGVDDAVDGLKETLGNKLTPAFDVLSGVAIGGISGIIDKISEIDAEALAAKVTAGIEKAKPYWEAFKDICGQVGEVLKTVGKFFLDNADTISKCIPYILGAVIAFKAFKVIGTLLPFVKGFASAIGSLAGKGISALAGKLFGVASGETAAGKAAGASSKQMMAMAKSTALLAASVLMIALGFALLTQSAIALANSGGLAIGVMAGLVIAVGALTIGMMAMLKTISQTPKKMQSAAMALLAMGAAVLMIGVGFALLTQSSIALANAGWGAIAVMVGMVAAIALLAIGAAALGTALTAGAVGFIAFGAAMLMAGAGAALAGVGLSLVASALPLVVAHGAQGAIAIAQLGAGMLVFAAGAALAGAACIVLGAGMVVASVGIIALGVAAVVAAVGIAALAAGALLLGVALAVGAGAIALLGLALPLAANGATMCVGVFAAFAGSVTMLAASLMLLLVPLAGIGLAAAAAAIAIGVFGVAMTTGAIGTLAMATALKGVKTQMKAIASSAKSAKNSLKSMRESISVVESGLDGLGSKAKSAMSKLTSAFDDSASKAEASGEKVGNGFTQGMTAGLATAPAVAQMGVSTVNAALMAGYSGAYSSGAFIGMGFANGMLSMLATVRNAANQLVAQANRAIEAKAKIGSPSKITTQYGEWYGEGYVNGISGMVKKAWNAAEQLVSFPAVNTPNLAMAYGGELSADYSYSRNGVYTFEIPVIAEGREIARATATYMQEELNRHETRNARKMGRV